MGSESVISFKLCLENKSSLNTCLTNSFIFSSTSLAGL